MQCSKCTQFIPALKWCDTLTPNFAYDSQKFIVRNLPVENEMAIYSKNPKNPFAAENNNAQMLPFYCFAHSSFGFFLRL